MTVSAKVAILLMCRWVINDNSPSFVSKALSKPCCTLRCIKSESNSTCQGATAKPLGYRDQGLGMGCAMVLTNSEERNSLYLYSRRLSINCHRKSSVQGWLSTQQWVA